jgi:hypothetical protein
MGYYCSRGGRVPVSADRNFERGFVRVWHDEYWSGGQRASDAERTRLAVTHRVKAAIERIDKLHLGLGQHPGASMKKTATFCVYSPDPAHPVCWSL